MEGTSITSAEWEVMRVVWSNQGITSRQIIQTLQPILEWKEGTVKSLINRLLQKGFLHQDTGYKPARYSTTLSQVQASQGLLQDTMEKNCCRDRGQLIQHLIESQPLSQADIDQMIQVLGQKRASAPQTVTCHCLPGQCTCQHEPHELCHPSLTTKE